MILDSLKNASVYFKIAPRLKKGFTWLTKADFSKLDIGRHEIDGDEVYALLQEYPTKPHTEGRWEAHKKYIDIQYVIKGSEIMGYAPVEGMAIDMTYVPEKDFMFLKGTLANGSPLLVPEGFFAVFFPQDAHMPTLLAGQSQTVRKVVVKVAVD